MKCYTEVRDINGEPSQLFAELVDRYGFEQALIEYAPYAKDDSNGSDGSNNPQLQKDRKENLEVANLGYLKEVLNTLSTKFNIPYEIIFDKNNPNKGYVDVITYNRPSIIINAAKASNDTPLHEYGHIFINLIKSTNKNLYSSLVKEILNTEQGKKELKAVQKYYTSYSLEYQIEETIVQLLGEYAAENLDSKTGLYKTIKKVWDSVLKFLSKTFSVEIKDISPNTSIESLSKLLVNPNLNFNQKSFIEKNLEDIKKNNLKSKKRLEKEYSDFKKIQEPSFIKEDDFILIVNKKEYETFENELSLLINNLKNYSKEQLNVDIENIKSQIKTFKQRENFDFDKYPLFTKMLSFIHPNKVTALWVINNSIEKDNLKNKIEDSIKVLNEPLSKIKKEILSGYSISKAIEINIPDFYKLSGRNNQPNSVQEVESYFKNNLLELDKIIKNPEKSDSYYKRAIKINVENDKYTIRGNFNNGNISISFSSDKHGMHDVNKGLFFKVLPKVIDSISYMFSDVEYNTISFTPVSGESSKGRDLRLKGYNIFAKRLFGQFSVIAENNNETIIPIPEIFKNRVHIKENLYQKERDYKNKTNNRQDIEGVKEFVKSNDSNSTEITEQDTKQNPTFNQETDNSTRKYKVGELKVNTVSKPVSSNINEFNNFLEEVFNFKINPNDVKSLEVAKNLYYLQTGLNIEDKNTLKELISGLDDKTFYKFTDQMKNSGEVGTNLLKTLIPFLASTTGTLGLGLIDPSLMVYGASASVLSTLIYPILNRISKKKPKTYNYFDLLYALEHNNNLKDELGILEFNRKYDGLIKKLRHNKKSLEQLESDATIDEIYKIANTNKESNIADAIVKSFVSGKVKVEDLSTSLSQVVISSGVLNKNDEFNRRLLKNSIEELIKQYKIGQLNIKDLFEILDDSETSDLYLKISDIKTNDKSTVDLSIQELKEIIQKEENDELKSEFIKLYKTLQAKEYIFKKMSAITTNNKYPVIDVAKETAWLKENIGDDLQLANLIRDYRAFGIMTQAGEILVDPNAKEGTTYHEAFHKVFQFSLTPREQKQLLKEVKESGGVVLEYMADAVGAKVGTPFNKLSESQLEEVLAEEFRDYQLTNEVKNVKSKNLFQRILDHINKILGLSKITKEQVYANIATAKYKNPNQQNNKADLGSNKFMRIGQYSSEDIEAITTQTLHSIAQYLYNSGNYDLTNFFSKGYKPLLKRIAEKNYLNNDNVKELDRILKLKLSSYDITIPDYTIEESVDEGSEEQGTSSSFYVDIKSDHIDSTDVSMSDMLKLLMNTIPDNPEAATNQNARKFINAVKYSLVGKPSNIDTYISELEKIKDSFSEPVNYKIKTLIGYLTTNYNSDDVNLKRQSFYLRQNFRKFIDKENRTYLTEGSDNNIYDVGKANKVSNLKSLMFNAIESANFEYSKSLIDSIKKQIISAYDIDNINLLDSLFISETDNLRKSINDLRSKKGEKLKEATDIVFSNLERIANTIIDSTNRLEEFFVRNEKGERVYGLGNHTYQSLRLKQIKEGKHIDSYLLTNSHFYNRQEKRLKNSSVQIFMGDSGNAKPVSSYTQDELINSFIKLAKEGVYPLPQSADRSVKYVWNTGKTLDDLPNLENEQFTNALIKYYPEDFLKQFFKLDESQDIKSAIVRKLDIEFTNLKSNKNLDLSKDEKNNVLKKFNQQTLLHYLESFPVFYGKPKEYAKGDNYANFWKRTKGADSTRLTMDNVVNSLQDYKNNFEHWKVVEDYSGKLVLKPVLQGEPLRQAKQQLEEQPILTTAIIKGREKSLKDAGQLPEEILKQVDRTPYESDVTYDDAGGKINFNTYRKIAMLSGSWDNRLEEAYQEIMLAFSEQREPDYDLVKDVSFPVLKTQGFGNWYKLENDAFIPKDDKMFIKHSLSPIIPDWSKYSNKDFEQELGMYMLANDIDMTNTTDGIKLQNEHIHDSYESLLKHIKNKKAGSFTSLVHHDFFGIQNEYPFRHKDKITQGTQMIPLTINNAYSEGKIDESLKPLVDEYQESLKDIFNDSVSKLKKEFEITGSSVNLDVFKNRLVEEAVRVGVSDNVIEAFNNLEKYDSYVDLLGDSSKGMAIFMSMLNKGYISMKRTGVSLALSPSVGVGTTVSNMDGSLLNYELDKDGNVLSAQTMIPLPTKLIPMLKHCNLTLNEFNQLNKWLVNTNRNIRKGNITNYEYISPEIEAIINKIEINYASNNLLNQNISAAYGRIKLNNEVKKLLDEILKIPDETIMDENFYSLETLKELEDNIKKISGYEKFRLIDSKLVEKEGQLYKLNENISKVLNKEVTDEEFFERVNDNEYNKIINLFDSIYDLSQVLGYRIPTQSNASIDTLEIIEYLPPYDSRVVVHPVVVAKTGADFDIDKMNIYTKDFKIESDELKILNTPHNRNLKAGIKVWQHKDMIPHSFAAVYEDWLIGENNSDSVYMQHVFKMKELGLDTTSPIISIEDITSVTKNAEAHEIYLTAKAGVGLVANHIKAHSQVQETYIKIYEISLPFEHNGSLSGSMSGDRSISSVLEAFMTSQVDAVNKPIAPIMGVNLSTLGSVLSLVRAGVAVDVAIAYINHPFYNTKEYLRITEKTKSKYASEYLNGEDVQTLGFTKDDLYNTYLSKEYIKPDVKKKLIIIKSLVDSHNNRVKDINKALSTDNKLRRSLLDVNLALRKIEEQGIGIQKLKQGNNVFAYTANGLQEMYDLFKEYSILTSSDILISYGDQNEDFLSERINEDKKSRISTEFLINYAIHNNLNKTYKKEDYNEDGNKLLQNLNKLPDGLNVRKRKVNNEDVYNIFIPDRITTYEKNNLTEDLREFKYTNPDLYNSLVNIMFQQSAFYRNRLFANDIIPEEDVLKYVQNYVLPFIKVVKKTSNLLSVKGKEETDISELASEKDNPISDKIRNYILYNYPNMTNAVRNKLKGDKDNSYYNYTLDTFSISHNPQYPGYKNMVETFNDLDYELHKIKDAAYEYNIDVTNGSVTLDKINNVELNNLVNEILNEYEGLENSFVGIKKVTVNTDGLSDVVLELTEGQELPLESLEKVDQDNIVESIYDRINVKNCK